MTRCKCIVMVTVIYNMPLTTIARRLCTFCYVKVKLIAT